MASAFPKNSVPTWSSGTYTVPRSVTAARRVPLNRLARTAAAEFNLIKNKKRKASSINHPIGFPVQQDPTASYTSSQKIMNACTGLVRFGKAFVISALRLQPSQVKEAQRCAERKRKNTNRNKHAAKTIRTAVNNANKAAKAANKAAANATLAAMNVNAVAERNQGARNLKHMANTKVPFSNRNNHNTRKPNNPKRARSQ